jgi:phosphoenolpyruvate-protein phosphotransferase (PTS system enzyme I)
MAASARLRVMKLMSGEGASFGIAIGPALVIPTRVEVKERVIALDRIAAELRRLDSAVDAADAQLSHASDQAAAEGHAHSDFVELHRSMLRFDLAGETGRLVRERHVAAEWAVRLVVREMSRLFANTSEAQTSAGMDDFSAVADRLLRVLLNLPEQRLDAAAAPGSVALAVELSPLDVLQLRRAGVSGIATERGGPTAHAAIVARDMEIPYIFGVPGLLASANPGELVCIDGRQGSLVVAPDELTSREYERRRDRIRTSRSKLRPRDDRPVRMDSGERVSLGANVDAPDGVVAAVAMGAEHIGLVRTELLYLDRETLPDEEQQYEDALGIIAAAQGRPVTFRTLDLGGDKLPASVEFSPGPNPALGIRAVRFSLKRRDIFRVQLRALLRAATSGPTRIMFPMVTGVTELRDAVSFCREVAVELEGEGVANSTAISVGTMIETPSAALTADRIAAACDFLSLGTNDLIQYAFAADRQNDDVRYLYHPLHPAVLRLMQYTIVAAERSGKPLSVCGDVAGDPLLTCVLLGLGVRDFSMSAAHLDVVRSIVRGTTLGDAQRLATAALAADSELEAEAIVLAAMRARFPTEMSVEDPTPGGIETMTLS